VGQLLQVNQPNISLSGVISFYLCTVNTSPRQEGSENTSRLFNDARGLFAIIHTHPAIPDSENPRNLSGTAGDARQQAKLLFGVKKFRTY